jgi:hypothetical protein
MFYLAELSLIPTGRGKKGKLRANLRQARTYEEWKEAVRIMDEYLGFDEWKQVRVNLLVSRLVLTVC